MTRFLRIGCCVVLGSASLAPQAEATARREDVQALSDRVDEEARQIVLMRAHCDRLLALLDRADFPSGDLAVPPDRDQRLNHVFPVARFDNRTLADVIATVSHAIGFPIVVNWNALASAGVTPQTLVSCNLADATAGDIVRRVVNSALGGNAGVTLQIGERQMVVTTADESSRHLVSKVYEVSPLLAQNDAASSVDQVTRLITETVAPDVWADAGGSLGTIQVAGSRIRIVQTAENIAEIDALLEKLDPEKEIARLRATLEKQQIQISAIESATQLLVARCRSLGIRPPSRLDHAQAELVPDLHCSGLPASDCVRALQAACGQRIAIDEPRLTEAGFDLSKPINLDLHDATLARALQSLVDAWSDGSKEMAYRIGPAQVTISTLEAISHATVQTRVYDLHHIRAAGQTRQEAVDSLIHLITEVVEPDSWRDAGGSNGAIRESNGQLIVTQTEHAQAQVKALLDQCRDPSGAVKTR